MHIHGASLKDTLRIRGIKSILTKNLLKFVNIIADNEEIADFAKKYHAKSVIFIDAFLPPIYREGVYKKFISKYGELINKRYIISMVGWLIYYQGKDLYGFDIALQTLKRFKEKVTKEVLLLVSVNGIRSEELHLKIKNYITENNLEKNVVFIYEELAEIWPIYIVSNIFIRPEGSILMRNYMIKFGIKKYKEKPIFGWGIANYRVLLDQDIGRRGYAHNNYIELLVDVGTIGMVLYYLMYIFSLFKLKKIKMRIYENYKYLFISLFLTILIIGYSSVYYYNKHFYILLATASVLIERKQCKKNIIIEDTEKMKV